MALFDFFKRKQERSPDRYAGKPFLKVIEAFILDAIGELPVEQRDLMQQITPKLQEIYKSQRSWQGIVAEAMHWKPNAAANIRDQWKKVQELDAANSAGLLPAVFAQKFADAIVADD